MSIVLGINLSHDTSVALIKNGKIYAEEEERYSKIKHNTYNKKDDYLFPTNALKNILKLSNTHIKEIDKVVCVSMATNDKIGEEIKIKKELKQFQNVIFISHHKAHILSGYLLSPYKEAVGLCYDGAGSIVGLDFNLRERVSGYYLKDNKIQKIYNIFDEIRINDGVIKKVKNSLGIFYYNFAIRCIPKGNEPEGSMMALSAYYTSNKYYKEIKKLIKLLPQGKFQIAHPYATKTNDTYHFCGIEWSVEYNAHISFEERANLAYAVQKVFEETLLHILNYLYDICPIDNLIISGGCALNSKVNGAIKENTGFENIYIPPAPNDGGTALGAALYAWNILLNKKRIQSPTTVDWGSSIRKNGLKDIVNFTDNLSLIKTNDIYKETAKLISQKKIILWARGNMEFGPRALGYRSIICHPGDVTVSKKLNIIKNRAAYRPIAPCVIADAFDEYFYGDADFYMNKVAYVKDKKKLAGITHKDGSARVQLVSENNEFYKLLQEVQQLIGVPILINTSLNLKGVPIARTVEDVVEVFLRLKVDAAIIGNDILLKKNSSFVDNYYKYYVNSCCYKIYCNNKILIESAILYMENLYAKRKRDQGTPFIVHPLNVLEILQNEFKIKMTDQEIVIALLHDSLWIDTESTKFNIEILFGKDILKKIIGLTKPHILENRNKSIDDEELYFNQIITLSNRLIYIKFADRLDNLRDIKNTDEIKRKKFIYITKKHYLTFLKNKKDEKIFNIIYKKFMEEDI